MEKIKKLKKERSPLQASFTKVSNELINIIDKKEANVQEILVYRDRMVDKYDRLSFIQQGILELILEEAISEINYDSEWEVGEGYREKYLELKLKADSIIQSSQKPNIKKAISEEVSCIRNTYRLPKLEFRKFDGELRNWLSFWGQFKQIHEDPHVPLENKFQYLVQCITPGSKAFKLVDSYPPSAENYPKVIDQLKNRFGREDLLVQVYVRELISMVMQKAVKGKVHKDLGTLYDSLESQLRALESLGRTKDKFTDFLCPLVESCLPEDVLRVWERKLNHQENMQGNKKSNLEELMEFLKMEVNSEERLSLARNGFGQNNLHKNMLNGDRFETVNALVDSKRDGHYKVKGDKISCLFCSREHESRVCYTARNMPLEERKKKVIDKRACFICLRVGHGANFCRTNKLCHVCNRKHAVILCPDVKPNEADKRDSNDNGKTGTSACLSNHTQFKQVLLSTLVVRVDNAKQPTLIRCLLDSGSQKSYISETIVRKIKLPVLRKERMVHVLFGGLETRPQTHNVHRIFLSSLDNAYKCNFEVLSQGNICGTVEGLNAEEYENLKSKYKITLPADPSAPQEVQMLIGADILGKLLTGVVKNVGRDLVAMETKMGWTAMGKMDRKVYIQEDSCMNVLTLLSSDVTISSLWKMDVLGISDPLQEKTEQELFRERLQNFTETIEVNIEGRYRVRLPWKNDHPPLRSNKELAWKRTHLTKERLAKENLLDDYIKVFEEWLKDGIIERAEEVASCTCHYLPHRPVIKEGSTTRVRPVFDASSHQKGVPSLNDCLEKGPKLIEEIPNVLERFRSKEIGVIADIEKAFLQLEVHPDERDVLRFFGMDGKEYRHKRVVFGVTSSPFLLGAVLGYHLARMEKKYGATVKRLAKAFYVDNCVISVDSKEEMNQFIDESQKIMTEGSFNLRGWESNCLIDRSSEVTYKDVNVLGLVWSLKDDMLRCNIPEVLITEVTKRTILSCAQRIFDPIGFLSPVTLYPKILLQELWSKNLEWDESVPDTCCADFEKWRRQLVLLKKVKIHRHSNVNEGSQLHVFADASEKAYAACLFARTVNEDGEVIIRLVRAKSRVAPLERKTSILEGEKTKDITLEKLTIPRLELMACLIGVRLVHRVKQALGNVEVRTYYWSDSSNALTWITKEGKRNIFVQNRVDEIRKFSHGDEWNYVPGEMNPADLPSRGCSGQKFVRERWWEGPKWLYLTEENWPRQEYLCPMIEEVKTYTSGIAKVAGSEEIDYLKHFSDYTKIIKMVAWMKRFMHNSRRCNENRRGALMAEEIIEAEKALFRNVQSTHIIGHRKSSLSRILEDSEGLLRIESKITERQDKGDFLYPVILPGDHGLVVRLIEYEHKRACHAGPQLLFGVLRERYWIIGAKKAIRRVVHNCIRCKRSMKKPIRPEPVVLPRDRVEDSAVFGVTGIDLAGPLYVKEGKVWVVLFTCAVYRAIHLELTSSMSTNAFLQALRRFIARRGRPGTIYTDNGTNFSGAETEFSKLDWDTIKQKGDCARIRWRFNPPTAAWWGGWWERLVSIMKDLLKKTINKARLDYEELLTIICECERVINSRPLTYYAGDADDMIPITPSLFLHDIRGEEVDDVDMVDGAHLTKRIKYRQRLMKDLRERFRREYLGLLMKQVKQGKYDRPVKIGDIVLIGDDQQKRLKWPLGIIVRTYPGKDNTTRCVSVKTQNGILIRPVQRIFPLELSTTCTIDSPVEEGEGAEMEEEEGAEVEEEVANEDDMDTFVEAMQRRTRTGRLVKHPTRLDLFNNAVFCLFDQVK